MLVVEDDFDLRRDLDEVLGQEGFDVVNAANGRDALDAIRQGATPEAIVADLRMPQMNGAALLAALIENPAWEHIPVIVISGGAPPTGWMGPFLRKPFHLNQLVAALRAAVRA